MADRPSRSVVDLDSSVVVTADHPVADGQGRGTEVALLTELAGVGSVRAGSVVEARSGLVVPRDHHDLPRAMFPRPRNPFPDSALDHPIRGDDVDPSLRLRPIYVSARDTLVQGRECPPLARIPLTDHLSQPQRPDSLADSPQPAAGQHGRELTRVPDRDHLRPHARRVLQQSRRRTRRRHPGLVQHNDAALRKAPAELLDVDERAVDRARRDPGILGQFASPPAGRRQPNDPIPGGLIQRAQHARRVRLPGARQRLDDLHTMTATRRQPDNLRLLVGQPPIRRRQRPSDLTLRDDRAPSVNPPERGIDKPPLAANEILGRHVFAAGAQNLAAIDEPVRTIPNLRDARALDGCRRELLEHGALVERVGPLRQPMLSSEPRRENIEVTLLAAGAESARRTGAGSRRYRVDSVAAACEEFGDFVAAESVLGRPSLDLLPPRVGLDPVLLALARVDRRRLRRALTPQREPALRRRLLHLVPAARELLKRPPRHILQLGRTLRHRTPLESEPVGDLGPQMRLVQVPGGLRGPIQRRTVQRREPAVRSSRQVRGDHMSVQLRVKRPRHPMQIRSRDQPLSRINKAALCPAADLHGGVLDPPDRGPHGSLMRPHELARDGLVGDREQDTDTLRSGERKVERGYLWRPPIAQASRRIRWISTPDQRVEQLRRHPSFEPQRPRPGARPPAGRLAAAGVVIVSTLRDLPLVIPLLTDDQLPDRKH